MVEKKGNLRIIIYGAGAIGGTIGGLLALASTTVVLIGRPGNVNAIREHGLQLVTTGGTHVVHLPAVTTPDQIYFGPADVVFLCVKGQDTDGAMRNLHAVVKDVPIFCFQNGVRNEEIASKYYPRVYGVMVRAGGLFTKDGEVTTVGDDPPGRFVVGRYPEGKDELVESVAAKLRDAGYRVVVTPEIMPYKWGKLVGSLTNAVRAITKTDVEALVRIQAAVQKEGKDILTQAGVHWVTAEELPSRRPKGIEQPGYDPSGVPLGSTWQSLTRQQGTVESGFLNGEIVRLAKKLGVKAPINEALCRITEEMADNHELPGKYTPAQLIKILNLG